MPEPDAAALAREFAAYNVSLSSGQLRQVQSYLELLLRWNRRINLTAIREPARILRELFAESMYLGTVLPLSGRLIDIGSGAGFPGLALKILQPGLAVTLVESNQRKCAFLEEVASALQLSDIAVVWARLGDVAAKAGSGFDIATTRAVAVTAALLRDASALLVSGGSLAVFSTRGAASRISLLKSAFRWGPSIAVPGSSRHVILIGKKSPSSPLPVFHAQP